MGNIKLRNNLKGPVIFRIPGRSVRLAPGRSVDLPSQFKDAAELKKLCFRKAVSLMEEKPEPVPPAEEEAAPAPAAGEEIKDKVEEAKKEAEKEAEKIAGKDKDKKEEKKKKKSRKSTAKKKTIPKEEE
jgi:hypothetical protein